MPNTLVPEDDLPGPTPAAEPAPTTGESTAPAPVAAADSSEVPQEDLPEVPASDLPDDASPNADPQEEGGLGGAFKSFVTANEGAARGVLGPLAPYAESAFGALNGIPGMSIAEQEQRKQDHDTASGIGEGIGLVGSMLSGTGEAQLFNWVGKGAAATAEAARIGKIGQTALRMGIEAGLFRTADNATKMVMGETNPEDSVASLLAGVPATMLFGGGLGTVAGYGGAKLQQLAKGKMAAKASQWMADLGSRFDLLSKHGGLEGTASAAAVQAQHLFDTVSAAVNDGFSLKRDSIEKLTANVDPSAATAHINELRSMLANVPDTLKNSAVFKRALGTWDAAVSGVQDIAGGQKYTPTPADMFEATDTLKKSLGDLAKFDSPRIENPDIRMLGSDAGSLYHDLRTSLENEDVWGEMGAFQKKLNGAYSSILTPMKDFIRAGTTKVGDVPQVDSGKLFNVFRQLGKGNLSAELRSDKISNFFEPAQNFLKSVSDLHAEQGLESNIPPVASDVLDEMLKKEVPAGAKVAQWLFDSGQSVVGMAGSHVAGSVAGAALGHPYMGYRAGEALYPLFKEMGKKPTRWAVSGLLRALSSGEYSAIPEAMNYAEGIKAGANRIENSVNNVFKIGGKQALESDFSEAAREQLKQFVGQGQMNQEIQNQKNPGGGKPMIESEPSFAHGGVVLAPKLIPPVSKKVPHATSGIDKISGVFPESAMYLGAAKARVNNYLNQVRPQSIKAKLPFDEHMEDPEQERIYTRALNIAHKPLSVLDHVKQGTLDVEHVKHLKQIYPELSNHLQKKISERMIKAQTDGEMPPYHVRQGMSLLMGAAVDSNLTPANIQAAQATFLAKGAQQQQGMAPKKKPEKSADMAGQYRTALQADDARQTKI